MEVLREEELEAIDGFLKWRKKRRKNENYTYNVRKIDSIENEIEASEDLRKNKMLLKFNEADSSSAVKQIAVKSQTSFRCTTRFLAGRMLMFVKLSLKSFVYDLAELLTFPEETIQAIYDQHQIERVYVFHILTDTDSTSMQFIIVSKVPLPNQSCAVSYSKYFLKPISHVDSISLTISGNSLTFTILLTKRFWACTRWKA